jgi:2-oxoglutarate ferredoxin oxidoreductase subunit delta
MARGMVLIDLDRCKGCGLCTHVCPSNILALSTETLNARGYHPVMVTDPEACTGCASCATICPDVVFAVYRRRHEARSAVIQSGVTGA